MRCVVDASVTVALSAPDEESEYAQRLIETLGAGDELLVPPIWQFEVSNAFVTRQRRQEIDPEGIARTNVLLLQLPIVSAAVTVAEAFGEVASLARQHNLSTYDASYLYLALREKLPLATLDRRLRAAAEAAGCEVFA